MFAIIKTGGKQYKVSEGDEIYIEKLEALEKKQVIFDEVLMIDNQIGAPFLKGAKVIGTIIKQGKEKKVIVFKYKPKKNYHKKNGHRQPYTKVRVDTILLSGKATTGKAVKTATK